MLNGDAIGGGAELALACDMRMQAAHARIGYIQAQLAITSAWGGGPDLLPARRPSRGAAHDEPLRTGRRRAGRWPGA